MDARNTFCVLGLVLTAGCIGGCALTTDRADVVYVPQEDAPRVKQADFIKTSVDVVDQRSVKEKVSCKKNSYGMEMAAIVSTRDVPTLIKEAVATELENRGCTIADDQAQVVIELQKFWNDFKIGFWSGSAVGEVILHVKVVDQTGSIRFSTVIHGESRIGGLTLASGKNAKRALDAALKDAVLRLMADEQFFDSLAECGTGERASHGQAAPPETAARQSTVTGRPHVQYLRRTRNGTTRLCAW